MSNIVQISNELEFCLSNLEARTLIDHSKLPVFPEVNTKHVVELNISLCNNINELNTQLEEITKQLILEVKHLGGGIYGGSSLIEDVSDVEVRKYRTTCLSKKLSRGLLDITSLQTVIGIDGEKFGVQLFNYLRRMNPFLLSMSSSSPYRFQDNNLKNTGYQSRRIKQYLEFCSYFPENILFSKDITSVEHYFDILKTISNSIKESLDQRNLDADYEELYKERDDGPFAPFDILAPHQIYWMTRFRPDHKNDSSTFSIETRVCDLPTTISRMQMINSFTLGVCYYACDFGIEALPKLENGNEFVDLLYAAKYGYDQRQFMYKLFNLEKCAEKGLKHRGFTEDAENMVLMFNAVLNHGNDAMIIKNENISAPNSLKEYLIKRLSYGE